MVPGVTRRTGATDLIGRHGTSLTLLGHTIIYDPGTGAVLGEEFDEPQPARLRLAYIASGITDARGAAPDCRSCGELDRSLTSSSRSARRVGLLAVVSEASGIPRMCPEHRSQEDTCTEDDHVADSG